MSEVNKKEHQHHQYQLIKMVDADCMQVPLVLEPLYQEGVKLLHSISHSVPPSHIKLLETVDAYVNDGIGWCIAFEEQHNPEKVLNSDHIPDELLLAMIESDKLNLEVFEKMDNAIIQASNSLLLYFQGKLLDIDSIQHSWNSLERLCPEFCDRNKSIKYYPVCFQAFLLDFLLSTILFGKKNAEEMVSRRYLDFIDYQLNNAELDTVACRLQLTQIKLNQGLEFDSEQRDQIELCETYWRGFYLLLSQYKKLMCAAISAF